MILNTLKLHNFKNYQHLKIEFSKGINCLLGKNGMGKTNLLDAIYYLSMTRSALSSTDQQNILHGERFFAINSEFHGDDTLTVNAYFEKGKKKQMKVAGVEPEKLSDHIGRIPSVLTTPDDTELIKEGSEIRRKLFDSVISQFDSQYLKSLMEYQRLVKQRNALLKQNEGRLSLNRVLLEVYDQKIFPLIEIICQRRIEFVSEFVDFFAANYEQIFSGGEEPSLIYKSDCQAEDFQQQYLDAFEKDVILQRTTMGPHKDDYVFQLNGRAVKKFGSQGQQKSFILAMKLAEYDFLFKKKETAPLLLLDDVFDKLDDERIAHLALLLRDQERFPQVFVTDARAERARQFFSEAQDVRFYEVKDGEVQA